MLKQLEDVILEVTIQQYKINYLTAQETIIFESILFKIYLHDIVNYQQETNRK